MYSVPILLVSGPGGPPRVLVGEDELAYRNAFGSFIAAWGAEAVWFDPQLRVLGSDGGVTLGRWRARVLGERAGIAVVVSVEGRPADVYVVDDRAMADRVVEALEREGVGFELAELGHLERPASEAAVEWPGDAAELRVRRSGEIRPVPPRPATADRFCPRCGDQPLHLDPLFDPISGRDGQRVCEGCRHLEALRQPS
ncbi:MAG TPA: hypothetical protein VF763_13610 [Candidatus Limnocylindrales bacterium]